MVNARGLVRCARRGDPGWSTCTQAVLVAGGRWIGSEGFEVWEGGEVRGSSIEESGMRDGGWFGGAYDETAASIR